MGILFNLLGGTKAITGGIVSTLFGSLLEGCLLIVKTVANPKFMAKQIISLLEWFAKSTKTEVDDKAVADVIALMKEKGIL